jgi:hypothetical protein
MKALLLSQLERIRNSLRVDRSELRLGCQAVRQGEYRRAIQHLDTAAVASHSTESELDDLKHLIESNVKE